MWDLKIDNHNIAKGSPESINFFEEAKEALRNILDHRIEINNVRHIVQSSKNLVKLLLTHDEPYVTVNTDGESSSFGGFGLPKNDSLYREGLTLIEKAIDDQTQYKGSNDKYLKKSLRPLKDALENVVRAKRIRGETKEDKDEIDTACVSKKSRSSDSDK